MARKQTLGPNAVALLQDVPPKIVAEEIKLAFSPQQIAAIRRELEREIREEERQKKSKRK